MVTGKFVINELTNFSFFLGPREVCQISIQSDESIESYRVHRHFYTFVKTVLSDLRGAPYPAFSKNRLFFFINRLSHVLKVYSQNIMTQL